MSLLLGQLIYTNFAELGFQALTSAEVPIEIRQEFIKQIVQQHWDSYSLSSTDYRAAYLHQISPNQTLFGWLYNDGVDDFGGSHVPYFVCYYLAETLQSSELKAIFTCLLKGPSHLVDRQSPPHILKGVEISDKYYQSARPGVGIFASIQEQGYLSVQQGKLFQMFVSEDTTGYHLKFANSISEENFAQNNTSTVKEPKNLSNPIDRTHSETTVSPELYSVPPKAQNYKIIQEFITRSELEPYQQILLSNVRVGAHESGHPWRSSAIGIAALIALMFVSFHLLRLVPKAIVPMSSSQNAIAELANPALEKTFLDTAPVWSVILSPDGQTVIGSGANQTIKVWNIESGKVVKTLSGHQDVVRWLAFTLDGNTLISGSGDQTIKIWDLQTSRVRKTLKQGSPVWGLALSPDGKTLYSGGEDGVLRMWEFSSGALLRTNAAHQSQIFSIAISPNGKTIATASLDQTIKLWNAQTGELIRTMTGHTAAVRAITFSPDGQTLASASWDKTLKLWNWQTGELIRTFIGHEARVVDIRFSPDGKALISGSVDRRINIWAVQDGTLLRSLLGHTDWVLSLALSPQFANASVSNRFVSSSKDQTIRIWQFR